MCFVVAIEGARRRGAHRSALGLHPLPFLLACATVGGSLAVVCFFDFASRFRHDGLRRISGYPVIFVETLKVAYFRHEGKARGGVVGALFLGSHPNKFSDYSAIKTAPGGPG